MQLEKIDLLKKEIEQIIEYTTKITLGLKVTGLINIQYVIIRNSNNSQYKNKTGSVYVIEANPRASRTIPFISKMTTVPMVSLALGTILGKSLKTLGYKGGLWKNPNNIIGIKAPVFSMSKLTGVDTNLGPEMKSTGEVMGIGRTFAEAYAKAQLASGVFLPSQGTALISVRDTDKPAAAELAGILVSRGFEVVATGGTAEALAKEKVPCRRVNKVCLLYTSPSPRDRG